MVDLLADDPTVGIRGAAATAAKGTRGSQNHAANVERLRKKYRKLHKSGELPKEGEAGRTARKVDRIREIFRLKDEYFEEKNRELTLKEAEAETVGVDISQENLPGMLSEFMRAMKDLEVLVEQPVESALSVMRAEGISDPETAVARYREAAKNHADLKKKVIYLRDLLSLRAEVQGSF
jgi:hypothetical protein